MPKDEFGEIARHLHETVSQLLVTKEHEVRLKLLRHMRMLLLESDGVLDQAASELL
jgi:hypothetical protein